MLYRILTEMKNETEITAIVSRHFDGFSLIPAIGVWKLCPERSLIVEVETDDLEQVTAAALNIKSFNEQEAVMIQQIANDAWLV